MHIRHSGILLAVVLLLLVMLIPLSGIPGLSGDYTGTGSAVPAEAEYREDFNGDGKVNITDVIALLLFQRANPGDLKADYNGDGRANVTDAIALLLAQRDGILTPVEDLTPASGDTTVTQGVTMVFIPGGTFQMGQVGITEPVHTVTLSPFQMGRYEITNYNRRAVMGGSPSYRDNHPLGGQDWYYAVSFCNTLSEAAGLDPCYDLETWECDFTKNGFRLPTEAEWEYACRAGTTTNYYTGDSENDLDRAGWYSGNSGNDSHAVGEKEANAFGLYDMHGNVMEWCNDWYGDYSSASQTDPTGPESGSYRIHRGGCWYGSAEYCFSAIRYSYSPDVGQEFLGFRVVRSGWTVPAPTYYLRGSVLENGSGLAVVDVQITGNGVDKTVTTGSDGSYSVPGLLDGTYTVTFYRSGYTFSPPSVEVTISGSDAQVQNIAATAGGPGPSPGDTTVIRGITMVLIPGGSFQMGQEGIAEPVHTVTLSAFQMSRYEITQAQYQAVSGNQYWYFTGEGNRPVDLESWYGAAAFCIALSDSAGLDPCYNTETLECDFSKNGFRLPTEAEWEYACRAGTTTKYYTGDNESDLDRAGWYSANSLDSTHLVGQKEPNAFGLYDMHGNVAEWCNDWYGSYSSESQTDPAGPGSGYQLVTRGGSFRSGTLECQSAYRSSYDQMRGTLGLSFRLVRRGEVVPAPDTHSLNGSVLENGSGLAGVMVRITGNGVEKTNATDSDGIYEVSGLSDGAYTVTPARLGYTFSPESTEVTIGGSDVTVEYIAAASGPAPSPGDTAVIQGITMVFIPGGTFQMGTNDTVFYWLEHSRPVHTVTLDSFQISRTEITQSQYEAVKKANPSSFTGDDSRPVEQVGWHYAATFCNWLSEMVGLEPCYDLKTWECDFTKNGFRLPTEAEWEYACRAGTTTKYYTGDDESDLDRAGWYYGNSGETTHPVGQKEPNAFGLYDMHGNVWEWCNDRWQNYYNDTSEINPVGPESGNVYVIRGGSWRFNDDYCLSANRYYSTPISRDYYIGFRVVRRY